MASQLMLTNETGFGFDALIVSYGIVRFTAASTAYELPGYQLFFSPGSNTWVNAAGLLSLGSTVAPGATLRLRWVDDNADQTSPDQIVGLKSFNVSAVPEPGAVTMLLTGLAVLGWLNLRQRRA